MPAEVCRNLQFNEQYFSQFAVTFHVNSLLPYDSRLRSAKTRLVSINIIAIDSELFSNFISLSEILFSNNFYQNFQKFIPLKSNIVTRCIARLEMHPIALELHFGGNLFSNDKYLSTFKRFHTVFGNLMSKQLS